MNALFRNLPAVAATAWVVLAKVNGFEAAWARLACLALAAAALGALALLERRSEASPIQKGMSAYAVAAAAVVWLGPHGMLKWLLAYPVTALYGVLFLVAVAPPLVGKEFFTVYFARRSTPKAVWQTAVFLTINRHLTAMWAVLFAAGMASSAVPGIYSLRGFAWETLFEGVLPAALMLLVGARANVRYPLYYQIKLGLAPAGAQHTAAGRAEPTNPNPEKESPVMSAKPTIAAINGSPHAGAGNTAMMIEMLREPLSQEGFHLEVISLCEKEIEYCTGCGFCIEKGKCWIQDDHAATVQRLLEADGVILASPVYFFHVTAQMKTFLDRSLAFGHKPQQTWKPGLAVCVSAGLGETQVVEYLAGMLRVYGGFAVGRLTAIATAPGSFLGKQAVEERAADLARDLARAVREKRRYPATDMDLRYYQFMGGLVRDNRAFMKDDFAHWEKLGLYSDFEAYIQQKKETPAYDPEIRKAWLKELMARHQAKKKGRHPGSEKSRPQGGPQSATSCRELLQMMPLGFNAAAADGLEAVYQFEISGDENFSAHLKISGGACTHHDGPAERPGVVIKAPAAVWLAIAKGELDGQQAFMAGKYKVEGDLSLLLKLQTLFSA
jgi:multimeric flavodoxin WrbA/putative sterol carrier protein